MCRKLELWDRKKNKNTRSRSVHRSIKTLPFSEILASKTTIKTQQLLMTLSYLVVLLLFNMKKILLIPRCLYFVLPLWNVCLIEAPICPFPAAPYVQVVHSLIYFFILAALIVHVGLACLDRLIQNIAAPSGLQTKLGSALPAKRKAAAEHAGVRGGWRWMERIRRRKMRRWRRRRRRRRKVASTTAAGSVNVHRGEQVGKQMPNLKREGEIEICRTR